MTLAMVDSLMMIATCVHHVFMYHLLRVIQPKDRSASDGQRTQQIVANPDAFTCSNDRPPTIHLFFAVTDDVIRRKPVCEGLLNVL
jgi:hypothetical protein